MKIKAKQAKHFADFIMTLRRFEVFKGRIDAETKLEDNMDRVLHVKHITKWSEWDPVNQRAVEKSIR